MRPARSVGSFDLKAAACSQLVRKIQLLQLLRWRRLLPQPQLQLQPLPLLLLILLMLYLLLAAGCRHPPRPAATGNLPGFLISQGLEPASIKPGTGSSGPSPAPAGLGPGPARESPGPAPASQGPDPASQGPDPIKPSPTPKKTDPTPKKTDLTPKKTAPAPTSVGPTPIPSVRRVNPDIILAAHLAGLQARAVQIGCSAGLVRPDDSCPATFLVVAADPPAVSQLNGFFSWLSDPDASSDQAPLLLSLDRLFREEYRGKAIAGGCFSEPDIISLLADSLRLILGQEDTEAILSFILECYRFDFQKRLDHQDPGQMKNRIFRRIEVTYEPSIYCTFAFNKLPD